MKKIEHGFKDYYYLTKAGEVFNVENNTFKKCNSHHCFSLKTTDNKFKTVSLKKLYKDVYGENYCIDTIKDLDNEQWKEIDGSDRMYLVSNYARLKSLHGYQAILLKPAITRNGYLRLELIIDGERKNKLLHRIVADYFLPTPKHSDYQIHHIDGNQKNNSSNNLCWVDPLQHRKIHMAANTINKITDSAEKGVFNECI